jgi:hypothetical protein
MSAVLSVSTFYLVLYALIRMLSADIVAIKAREREAPSVWIVDGNSPSKPKSWRSWAVKAEPLLKKGAFKRAFPY